MGTYTATPKTEARAYVEAYTAGKLGTHFVVISYQHLKDLKERGAVKETENGWVKVSTGRPLYYAYTQTRNR